jgi:UDP-N-acetylglucosamine:LPS N-acetylglucosamine transferase
VIVEDVDLPQQLGPTVAGLLQDQARRGQMEAALAAVAMPDAAARIAAELVKLAQRGGRS